MNFFTAHDGVKLAYEDEGEGRPLLCLPGLTRNARDFDDLAAVLPPGNRLIRLTSRGRGASDWAGDHTTYSIPSETRDVIEFMDFLGLDKATIIGTSRGGLIAMVMAATVKDRLAGVLLNDIGPVITRGGIDRIMEYLGKRPAARNLDEAALAIQANMRAAFPDVDLATWRVHAERWFLEDEQGVELRYDPKLREAMAAVSDQPSPDLWPLFDEFEGLPLAALRGENSDLLSAETLLEMQTHLPHMISATVPNRGHVPFLDEPESVAVLSKLLDQI